MAFHLNGYSNFHDDNQDWIVSKIKSIEDTEAHTEELAEAAQNSADASQASAEASQLSAEASQLSAEASQLSAENAAESETNAAQSAIDAADTVEDTINQINLLQSRVDNIIPSGTQTEGNTELLDIRVGTNGFIYPSAGDAVRSQFQDVEKALDYQFQYLKETNRTNGKYYNQNSDTATSAENYAIYEPFYIPAGTYYFHNFNRAFTNIKINNEIHTLNYYEPDVTQTDGHFTIQEGGIIYITSGQANYPQPAMLSTSDLAPLYEYRTGMYDVSVKETALPEKLKNLTINDISVQNIKLYDMYDITPSAAIRYEDDLAIQEYHGSGNDWWNLNIDYSRLINNFIQLCIDVVSITGAGTVYLFGKNTNNSTLYLSLGYFNTVGKHTFTGDLNYYVVYNDLDLSKPLSLGIANRSNPDFVCTYSAIDTYNVTTELDTNKTLPSNLNAMLNNINSNTSAIEALEGSEMLVSPDGSKFVIQVDNNGNITASPVVPQNTLFIGNSLLLGFQTFGMCASDNDHDYYHYITNAITQKKPTATYTKQSGTAFEGCTTQAQVNTWLNDTLLPLLNSSLNLVIVQLGDNVNTPDKVNMFTTSCKQLLAFIREHATNARVAFVASWYSSVQRINIITEACNATGCMFINITDIPDDDTRGSIGNVIHRTSESTTTYEIDSYTDDAVNHTLTINFTVGPNTYSSIVPYTSYVDNANNSITITGEYTVVVNSGVASHPGNLGMQRIAERVLNKLGIE